MLTIHTSQIKKQYEFASLSSPEVISINNGFLIECYTVSSKVTKESSYYYNPELYKNLLFFVDVSGNITLIDTDKYSYPTLGFLKNKPTLYFKFKDSTKNNISGPERQRLADGYDWTLCNLAEDNKTLIDIGKDRNFKCKDEERAKINFMKNKILICGSIFRRRIYDFILQQIFNEVHCKPKEIIIGNIENGFPADYKVLKFSNTEPVDCAISQDGLTGCIVSIGGKHEFEEIIIVDL